MHIGGMQKMTLLDFPSRIACIVFTHGCNFRCPYCHNAPLVTGSSEGIGEDELFAYLEKRRGILDGVCISGGEPFLQRDLLEFMSRVKDMGYDVKIDTNGTDPARLAEVIRLGLCDYVAMDIKNSREKYPLTVCSNVRMQDIERSVAILMSGDVEYEFRTTVTRQLHTHDDMRAIGEWIAGASRYYLQTFRDSGELVGSGMSAYDDAEMRSLADCVRPLVPSVKVRGEE